MDQGGPIDTREAYFKEASEEMIRARTLCAKANAVLPDDPSYMIYLEELFGRDLSAEGLRKAFEKVGGCLTGKVAVKLHTTEQHRETLKVNGWTFCPVDIMDEDGTVMLPVKGGKWFTEMSMGKNITNYDSMLVLTHFKGHTMGGFGGSNKNIGIGCADGRVGKAMIHTVTGSDNMWSISEEELMERIAESSKATVDYFAPHITFVNVMRNMSVSCDCEGVSAQPVVTPNIGILASTDILAIDQASVDLIYALSPDDRKALVERMETRHGLRQLSYMKERGMGNDRYQLLDLDNGDAVIQPADAVKGVKPFPKVQL